MLTYFKESWEELRNNVTWLSKEQSSNYMVVVAVFSVLFALATWGVDMYFSDAISGKLFNVETYKAYIDLGFWGIIRLAWYVIFTAAILYGVSTFFTKKN